MIEIVITVGSIILIIGLICQRMGASGLAFLLGVIGAYFLSGGILVRRESCKPTAIDVYKGKTTLEITYKDSVPIDSVVVFKDKEK